MTDKAEKKGTIGRDVALAEFKRFGEAMDLDHDTSKMDEEDLKGFEGQRDKLLDAMQAGSLIVNGDGEPVYTPQRGGGGSALTFQEPTGAALQAMDRRKATEDVGKMYAAMGEITGCDAKTFSRMRMADLKICMAITTLFLG